MSYENVSQRLLSLVKNPPKNSKLTDLEKEKLRSVFVANYAYRKILDEDYERRIRYTFAIAYWSNPLEYSVFYPSTSARKAFLKAVKNGTVQIVRIPRDIYLSAVANNELSRLPPSKDTPGNDFMYLITGVVEI